MSLMDLLCDHYEVERDDPLGSRLEVNIENLRPLTEQAFFSTIQEGDERFITECKDVVRA